ncbi:hypothetical protein JEQ12_003778, partial [Ovis aries]
GETRARTGTAAACTGAGRSGALPTASATRATSWQWTARPAKMWMNVPQAWPSVRMAASTRTAPSSVCAMRATSWVLMAGSAT